MTAAKTLTIIIGKILTATHEPHTKLLHPTADLRWVSTMGLMWPVLYHMEGGSIEKVWSHTVLRSDPNSATNQLSDLD